MESCLLIPPSSHFLKTLTNLFLYKYSLNDSNVLKVWCIFPTKRAGLYFKNYLKEKAKLKEIEAGFFPKIQSLEEFVENLYTDLTDSPSPQVPDVLRVFTFLEVLEKKKNLFSEKREENLRKYFSWD